MSFRYPPDLSLAPSASSSPPASSSSEVSSWDIALVRNRLFSLDIPELTWMIRMLQFVSTLDKVWDEVRVKSLQVLQLAYDVK